MTLKQLQVFLAVADLKSFSRAGEQVSLTQSTVSLHIKALEEELEARLFDRSVSEIQLTAVGRLFYDHAKTIMTSCDQARSTVRRFQGLEQASLRVGASTIPAACLIPDLLGRLNSSHPGIRIELQQGDSQQVLHMLGTNQVELGLIGARPTAPGITYRKIATDRIILVTKANSQQSAQIPLQHLATCPLIAREAGSGTRQATDSALRQAGMEPANLNIIAQLGSSEALRRAVLGGAVYAFISALAVEPELASGSIIEVVVENLKIERDIYLIRHQDRSVSNAGKIFTRLLTETVISCL